MSRSRLEKTARTIYTSRKLGTKSAYKPRLLASEKTAKTVSDLVASLADQTTVREANLSNLRTSSY